MNTVSILCSEYSIDLDVQIIPFTVVDLLRFFEDFRWYNMVTDLVGFPKVLSEVDQYLTMGYQLHDQYYEI